MTELMRLDWDTKFFGVNCAKVILDEQQTSLQIDQLLKDCEQFDFVSIVNKDANTTNAILLGEKSNAFLIDTNIQYGKKFTIADALDANIVVYNNFSGDKKILDMAHFEESKFLLDPNLKDRNGSDLYKNWLANSFNKDNKYFSLYKKGGDIQGYVLFSFNENNCVIELIAVDQAANGLGIGKKLFKSIEHTALNKGYHEIRVGTQVKNIGAINFYHKNGCSMLSVDQIFHLWNI